MPRKGKKRLTCDIPENVHKLLSEIAELRNITITKLILRQIAILIKNQEIYDNE